jgi:hypothetical protein
VVEPLTCWSGVGDAQMEDTGERMNGRRREGSWQSELESTTTNLQGESIWRWMDGVCGAWG